MLFVVGAGASSEIDIPHGNQFKLRIAQKLRFDENGLTPNGSSVAVYEAIKSKMLQEPNPDTSYQQCLNAAHLICQALPLVGSIDQLLDIHSNKKEVALCAKLAIAKTILQAEKDSKFYNDNKHTINFVNHLDNDIWFYTFWKLLSENVNISKLDNLFDNISFIVFNYDRCVEYFLLNAISTLYSVNRIRAIELVKKLKIYHPYGSVGKIKGLTINNDGLVVDFGESCDSTKLLQVSKQVKTFTEQVEDKTEIESIRQLVLEVETIVFLGFSFQQQNMDLLAPNQPSNISRVFHTTKGVKLHKSQ